MDDVSMLTPYDECTRLLHSVLKGVESGQLHLYSVFTSLMLLEQCGFAQGEPLPAESLKGDLKEVTKLLLDTLAVRFANASPHEQAETLIKLAQLMGGVRASSVSSLGIVHTPAVLAFMPNNVFRVDTKKDAPVRIRNVAPAVRRVLFDRKIPGVPSAQLKEYSISVRGSELLPREVAKFMPSSSGISITPAHWLGFLRTYPHGRKGGNHPIVCMVRGGVFGDDRTLGLLSMFWGGHDGVDEGWALNVHSDVKDLGRFPPGTRFLSLATPEPDGVS